ncbi:MAG: hypothetical protein OEU46_12580, partial [Alphaproteobacteria bacterium]|nr:hypothetical protein [Alphaproteobacteria bacterium]
LTLHAHHDMHAFVDYLGRQEETHGIPTSHDPRYCYMHPGNSFWIYVRHTATGDIVACHAQRLIVTSDFVEECMAQILFENLAPNLDTEPLGIDDSDDIRLSGRIVFGGGTYIRPDWRGAGLLIFNRASRTIALRHFRADYLCGMQMNTARRKTLALTGFEFAHVKPFIKGGLPHKPQADDVQVSWSSRAEWMETIRRELANQDAATHTPRQKHGQNGPLGEAAAAGIRA